MRYRDFTVKARTDMELLLLEKAELYAVDSHYKREIFSLFENSN